MTTNRDPDRLEVVDPARKILGDRPAPTRIDRRQELDLPLRLEEVLQGLVIGRTIVQDSLDHRLQVGMKLENPGDMLREALLVMTGGVGHRHRVQEDFLIREAGNRSLRQEARERGMSMGS